MSLTVGSLFAGIGGFDLGLERAGWTTQWQVEIDDQCRQVLRRHFPEAQRYIDVREVGADELEPVDLICGGFPCQDLSVAGRREGLDGERSGLFFEFMRVVDEVAPRWVLIENVPGLLSSNDGRDMGTVVGTLADLGYGWSYRVLDTQYFGPPQRRRRVFIVGYSGGPCPPEILFEPESLPWDSPPSREAGQGATDRSGRGTSETLRVGGREQGAGSSYDNTPIVAGQCHGTNKGHTLVLASANANAETTRGHAPSLISHRSQKGGIVLPFDTTQITSKGNYSRPKPGDPCHPLARGAHPPSVAYSTYPYKGAGASGLNAKKTNVAQTLQSFVGGNQGQDIVQQSIPRRLTPTECERLQGFPDGWTAHGIDGDGERVEMADTPRYRMLGNAVSVPVAEWIGRRILEPQKRTPA